VALYKDRRDAGQKLAQDLMQYQGRSDVIVLALPRGGVPVAYEVARKLDVPLDIFLVRKLGVPGQEELALGAIASGGIQVTNREVVRALHIPDNEIEEIARRELEELNRRERAYRGNQPRTDIGGKIVILIDDGLATGASMRAAVDSLRLQHPAKIVVAVPTASREVCEAFKSIVDQIVCSTTPQPFFGVGVWYDDFEQTSDEEVRALLEMANTQK
jgi:putative phosphoribosyl transferase